MFFCSKEGSIEKEIFIYFAKKKKKKKNRDIQSTFCLNINGMEWNGGFRFFLLKKLETKRNEMK